MPSSCRVQPTGRELPWSQPTLRVHTHTHVRTHAHTHTKMDVSPLLFPTVLGLQVTGSPSMLELECCFQAARAAPRSKAELSTKWESMTGHVAQWVYSVSPVVTETDDCLDPITLYLDLHSVTWAVGTVVAAIQAAAPGIKLHLGLFGTCKQEAPIRLALDGLVAEVGKSHLSNLHCQMQLGSTVELHGPTRAHSHEPGAASDKAACWPRLYQAPADDKPDAAEASPLCIMLSGMDVGQLTGATWAFPPRSHITIDHTCVGVWDATSQPPFEKLVIRQSLVGATGAVVEHANARVVVCVEGRRAAGRDPLLGAHAAVAVRLE